MCNSKGKKIYENKTYIYYTNISSFPLLILKFPLEKLMICNCKN